jgi:hypothetical protein
MLDFRRKRVSYCNICRSISLNHVSRVRPLQHPVLDVPWHISNTHVSLMTRLTTPVTNSFPLGITPPETLVINRIPPICSKEARVHCKNRFLLDEGGGIEVIGRLGEDGDNSLQGGFCGLGEDGGPDLAEVRVEVHEENIHKVPVFDIFTSNGLETLPGSLEGQDVEVHRLRWVMGGGEELPSCINPGGKIGGLKLVLEGFPELRGGGGGGGEEAPVLRVNSEEDDTLSGRRDLKIP